MKALADCLLYTFIDTAFLHGRAPELVARQLVEGGSDLVQLRAKTSSREEVQDIGEKVSPILAAAGVGLVINDYPQIAASVGAPFCHVGQEDFFATGCADLNGVRPQFSPAPGHAPVRFGLSTHEPAQAQSAIAAGADYIAIGPVFATGTKPTAKPVTLQYVRWAAEHVAIPWFAIGGITLANLDEVLAAGAHRVCVVSAILAAPDLVRTCQRFKDRLLSRRCDQSLTS